MKTVVVSVFFFDGFCNFGAADVNRLANSVFVWPDSCTVTIFKLHDPERGDSPMKNPPPQSGFEGDKQRLISQARAQHDELLEAIYRLELALASAAPRRERVWNKRVIEELERASELLDEHFRSIESDDGLLSMIVSANQDSPMAPIASAENTATSCSWHDPWSDSLRTTERETCPASATFAKVSDRCLTL